MFSGFMMTLTTHGIREGSKADRPDEAKVKEREKEKEKAEEEEGSSDQGKGKGRGKGRRKGRSHMVNEEAFEEDWQEGEEWNESYEGYWADDQNCNEGYWAYDDLYYMDEYGYFQKKGKGKGKKGKKGKDDDGKGGESQEMEKASQTVFNLRPHQPTPSIQNQQQQQAHYSSAASSSGHGFLAFAETESARVDALASTYAEQEEHRRTSRGGQNQRDATSRHYRKELKRFPVLVADLDALRQGVQRRPARVLRQVGLQEGEASWKPLAKGTPLFSYGCSAETEVPSHSECFAETKESDEQQECFFISYCTD